MRVQATTDEHALYIVIEDDGVGLGDDWTEDRVGLGLSVTRERIAMLHPTQAANLLIDPREGGGTRVRVSIPTTPMEAPGE